MQSLHRLGKIILYPSLGASLYLEYVASTPLNLRDSLLRHHQLNDKADGICQQQHSFIVEAETFCILPWVLEQP